MMLARAIKDQTEAQKDPPKSLTPVRGAEREREYEGLLMKGTKANRALVLLDSSPFTTQVKGARLYNTWDEEVLCEQVPSLNSGSSLLTAYSIVAEAI